jgi:class 3 adenylate cyclase
VAAIRTPDQRLRVFVSSTLGELAPERAVVREAIDALRLTPVMFELGARPHPPQDVYRAYLEQSDIFVGLYWQRYGWVAPDMEVSGLEDEFRLSAGMPRLLYVKEPADEREPSLVSLLQQIETEATGCYRPFRDPAELGDLIRDDLAVLITERFAAATHAAATVATASPPREPTVGTRSVLFTDVVASTELRQRLGEDAADLVQRRLDEILADAVTSSGGSVVKGLGDGVLAVFDAAADAVAAGVRAQRGVAGHNQRHRDEAFEIRVGISVGDVMWDGSDVHGTAVIEASRLCDAARGGQVLVSDLVRALTRGRGGFAFESVGELTLKGLTEPVAACWVDIQPFVDEEVDSVPFPGLLAPPAAVDYVGRGRLLDALTDAWAAAAGGTSRAVLLVGEPGAGKTRTASEIARHAFTQGAVVLYGRCEENLGVPYQPFVEALDWQTAHDPALPLGRFPGDLVQLVPDLASRIDGLPAPIRSDPQVEQHRLFEAVTSWIAAASAERGLVLVLDDLHWATTTTVQLLTHLLEALQSFGDSRALVVAAYRDTDVDRIHPLAAALGHLRRLPHVTRLPVEPLDDGEVLALVEAAAGHPLDEDGQRLAALVAAETEGNPFFVGEVLRHFVETGVVHLDEGRWVIATPDTLDVPEGVRDVVGRRLTRLSPQTNDMLRIAALVGREVDLETLADLVEGGLDTVLDALDEALRARLVDETRAGTMRFAHALVRSTLADELSATRQRHAHRRILAVLERRRPDDLNALAHHAVLAGPIGGDPTHAVAYCVAAGERALESRAGPDAVAHFATAIELIDDATDVDVNLGLRARCGLGEAQRDTGDPTYRQTLLDVTTDALAHGDTDLALRAVLSNSRVIESESMNVDHQRVAALEAVLDQLDDTRPERAALFAAVAAELHAVADAVDRRLDLADRAVAIATQSGDSALLARVVVATLTATNVPDRVLESLDRDGAAIPQADACGDPLLRAATRGVLATRMLYHGRTDEARALVEEMRRIADDEGTPPLRYRVRCILTQTLAWDGDLAGAERQNQENLELGVRFGEPDATLWWHATYGGVIEAAGRVEELLDTATMLVEQLEGQWWPKVGLATALVQAGRIPEARHLVERHHLTDPTLVPQDFLTLRNWLDAAWLVRVLGRSDDAARLLSIIEPYRDLWPSITLWLNLPMRVAFAECQVMVDQHDAAQESARAAWQALVDRNIRCHLPYAAIRLADVLHEIGTAEARSEARRMLEHGLREATDMGMDRRIADIGTRLR